MPRRRPSHHLTVLAFRTSERTAQRIREAAAADDRRVSAFLRRVIERALEQSSGNQSSEAGV